MYRRVRDGMRERITIGQYPDVSLAKAGEEERKLRAEKTLGLLSATAGSDYAECLEEFLAGKRDKNKASTVDEKERLLEKKRLLKGHFPFSEDVTKIGSDLLQLAGHGQAHPLLPIVALEAPRKGQDRERVLTDAELAALWLTTPATPYGQIIRLIIITGQRPGDRRSQGRVRQSDELQIVWPAEAMKGK